MALLQSQKNKLLKIIKSIDISPLNFKFISTQDNAHNEVHTITYIDTDFYFSINPAITYFLCSFSPGEVMVKSSEKCRSWEDVTSYFLHWLICLTKEISEPDLWHELETIGLSGELVEENSSMHQFTYLETEQIARGIENVRTFLLDEVAIDSDQSQIINSKLDYLIETSKRMGRIDWKNVFIGIIVDLTLTLALSPEQGNKVIELFKLAVSGIIRLLNT